MGVIGWNLTVRRFQSDNLPGYVGIRTNYDELSVDVPRFAHEGG